VYSNLLRSSAAPPARQNPPGSWRDLKRDWQRWSRAERIAAECFLALLLMGSALALASSPLL